MILIINLQTSCQQHQVPEEVNHVSWNTLTFMMFSISFCCTMINGFLDEELLQPCTEKCKTVNHYSWCHLVWPFYILNLCLCYHYQFLPLLLAYLHYGYYNLSWLTNNISFCCLCWPATITSSCNLCCHCYQLPATLPALNTFDGLPPLPTLAISPGLLQLLAPATASPGLSLPPLPELSYWGFLLRGSEAP